MNIKPQRTLGLYVLFILKYLDLKFASVFNYFMLMSIEII